MPPANHLRRDGGNGLVWKRPAGVRPVPFKLSRDEKETPVHPATRPYRVGGSFGDGRDLARHAASPGAHSGGSRTNGDPAWRARGVGHEPSVEGFAGARGKAE